MDNEDMTVVDNVYIRLTEYIYNCTKLNTDFYIAKSMLTNLEKFPDITIYEVAQESFSSTTSVTKFCRKLGYQNFYELRHAVEQQSQGNTIFQDSLEIMNETQSLQEGISAFVADARILDEQIFKSFDYIQIERICQLILASTSVAIIVPMFAFESGNLLKELLHRLGINTFMINRSSDASVISEIIESVDLTIIISMTGKWVNKRTGSSLVDLGKDIVLLTSNLNVHLDQHMMIFKEIVQLNRIEIKRSNYVSSRLYVNYFIAIFYRLSLQIKDC